MSTESTGATTVAGAPTVQDFLRIVAERGGTDLHITAESPPVMRINGQLRPLPFPPLSANDTKTLCYSVLTETQKHRFEEAQELDFGIRA
jgi:twitching motility protein PilT